jgi:DNA-directed RNA polymerase specialized sigma24 family protein
MPDSVCRSWEPHLESYLLGDSNSLGPLYKSAKRSLLRFLSRRAPFMPEDVREEVFDQIFVRLIENPPAYDPAKGSLRSLMFGLARNALKQVRATYVAAGQKTRLSRNENEFATKAAEPRLKKVASCDEYLVNPVEEIPSLRWTDTQICAMAESHELLASLPPDRASALWLVRGVEYSATEAGKIMGKTRFAVARLLQFTPAEKPSLIGSVLESRGRSNSVAA